MSAQSRVVLGGRMHGKRVSVLHGSIMLDAPSGQIYRRYKNDWWVPDTDSDAEAERRLQEYVASFKSPLVNPQSGVNFDQAT